MPVCLPLTKEAIVSGVSLSLVAIVGQKIESGTKSCLTRAPKTPRAWVPHLQDRGVRHPRDDRDDALWEITNAVHCWRFKGS